MHFSLLLSAGTGAWLSGTGLSVAIAALALILGAEIAGIVILISKMVRARNRGYAREEDPSGDSSFHAASLALLFGAVPQSSFFVLSVLATLTAVLAVVFLILLIIFRAKGYDFAASSWYQEAEARRAREASREPTAELPEELPADADDTADDAEEIEACAEEAIGLFDEEQSQEEYTEAVESEDEIADLFAEEVDSAEAAPTEEADEPAPAVVAEESAAPVGAMETVVTPADGEPALADGSKPYKIVEKYVTETYKEVYTETPAPTAAAPAPAAASNDAVLEKLDDILVALKGRDQEAVAESRAEDKPAATGAADGIRIVGVASDEEDDEDEDDDVIEDGDTERGEDEDEDRDTEGDDTDGDHFTGNERIIGFDEKTGCYIVAHYRKSFEAKLIQARPNIKKYYSELRNALLSYKGTKNRISWTADSFHNGRMPIAKINVKTRILELYLALDPASLDGTVYRGRDVGAKKKYADTPFQYKLRTPRKFKWAMELVARVCEEHGLTPIDIDPVDYEQQYPFDTTENLVARGLIKEYIREEKPATSFELDPDHTPEVPEEDATVIPANANFSWEFDNDAMVEKEPEEATPAPAEEPAEEPAVEPEPIEETPAAPASTVTRETVKVTEMRYTERYYANAEPIYERVVTTTEPIEAEAIPAIEGADTAPTEAVECEDVEEIADIENTENTENIEDTEAEEDPIDIWGDLTAEDADTVPEIEEDADTFEESDAADDSEELFFADDREPAVEETDYEEADTEETDTEDADEAEDSYEETLEEDTLEEDTDETEAAGDEDSYEPYEDVVEEEYLPASAEVSEEATEPEPEPEPKPEPRVIRNPELAVVDIASLEEHFPSGALINLEALKALELVLPSAKKLKIYTSSDTLGKAFTVEANQFTQSAFFAISAAGGSVIGIL